MKFIKISFLKFILGYIALTLILYFISSNLLIKDFDKIEDEQNTNNLKTFLKKLDTELENLHSTAEDYSKWDDTNIFLADENKAYIFENFREGTNTLESLDIDFIIFANKKDKVLFSKYQDRFDLNKNQFENRFIHKFKDTKQIDTIVTLDDKIVYFIKAEVLNSDKSSNSNGYLILGKLLSKESLDETLTIFKEAKTKADEIKDSKPFSFDSTLLPKAKLLITYTKDELVNDLSFYDDKDQFIFSLSTKNNRVIHINGLHSIYLLNTLIDIILFILLFLLYKNQTIVEKYNVMLSKKVNRKTKELQELNDHLENRVKEEVDKNTKKQLQLFEQSKMASMGSMVGNIVHQWRQPLTQISMLASSIKLDVAMNMLDSQKVEKDMNTITQRIEYMDEVISTFRSFLMEKKEEKEIVLQDSINKALDIVDITLKDLHIKLIKENYNEAPIKKVLVASELSEVIINILNNAKDILIEKNIKEPWVKITLEKLEHKVLITIEDNVGGIPQDVLPNIFKENFSTKDASIGTGLGLYMSQEIVSKSFNGNLYCTNTQNGAKFYIEIPLDKELN